ncbi:hypothetical protein IFM89_039732 [Coptis chinensis]|uniref:RanBP2-type domain-containing protein n=1 Tax=Coptis chinensis TaxID=261450 RepID=A0A835GUM0_9MAGN|nr:hypothetical protein IFM89_039732 [Coptis chinensis]
MQKQVFLKSLLLPQIVKATTKSLHFHSKHEERDNISSSVDDNKKLKISHPWFEWIHLMESVFKKGYFQNGANPFGKQELTAKDTNFIRTALLNFARDRFDIIRYLSRKDIAVVLGSGCPSIDRKVVNSGKRLRAHVHVDEGKVCSSCSLRGSCERAYVKAREEEGGRTVDVMRILLTYGLDPVIGSVENTPCLNKMVKESVRRLLSEMVEFSSREHGSDSATAVCSIRQPSLSGNSVQQQKGQIDVPMRQGDWICPKCNFLNFAKNIKCLRCDATCQERLRKLGEDQEHLPLKKGDWLCGKCNFLNFAKNTRCLLCKEKPPNRQLNPGEWECDSCNYVNFKRNMRRHDRYNGRSSAVQERQSRKESEHLWTNMEDDADESDNSLCSWNRFEDFPVAEGNSEVSQNPLARERWKREMSNGSHSVSRESAVHDDLDFQLTDDEEIAEWFECRKKSEPQIYKDLHSTFVECGNRFLQSEWDNVTTLS